jgi:serine/threonine-protein kinase HipA
MNELDVWLSWQRAGRLTRAQRRHGFTYQLDASEALSLTMPLRVETYHYEQGLHPLFQMNMPEGYLRQAIERYAAKQFGSDDLNYLALLGNHQIGRVRYTRVDSSLPENPLASPSLNDLLTSDYAELFQQLFERYALHSGVAGVQPKFLLDMAPDASAPVLTDKVTLPLKKYIVKSWGPEYPELACNEFFCLTLARDAGLTTPDFFLSDNSKLLVSERFDVDANNEPLGFEDFCVLQGKTTQQKYDASLESCVNTLVSYISPELLQQTLFDFFKLTLINIKLRNGDAHLKNFGVLYDNLLHYREGKIPAAQRRLAPIYDLVNTTAYLPQDTMALSLTGSKRWPKWKVLEKFARIHCRLNGKQIDQAMDEVEQACAISMNTLSALIQRHPQFEAVGDVLGKLVTQRIA